MTGADASHAAEALRALHQSPGLLVVANAFDAGSARVLEQVGFPTLATSSAAMAWGAGVPAGQKMSRATALEQHARVVRAVNVPVSIDFEEGHADEPGGIESTVEAVIAAGFAGLNWKTPTSTAAGRRCLGWRVGCCPNYLRRRVLSRRDVERRVHGSRIARPRSRPP